MILITMIVLIIIGTTVATDLYAMRLARAAAAAAAAIEVSA